MTKTPLGRLLRQAGLRVPTRSRWSMARRLVIRANSEREARLYSVATALYEEALRLVPGEPRFLMQYGHMLKEAGDYSAAEDCYEAARKALPNDPDVAIQLGHFYKVAGRPEEAEQAYRRATELRPGWAEAQEELARVRSAPEEATLQEGASDQLAAELLPRDAARSPDMMREGFFIRRLGAAQTRTRGAYRRVLRGIEAIHGFVVSAAEVTMLTVIIDGQPVHREQLEPALRLGGGQGKYVFNLWHDFSAYPCGPRQVELRAARRSGPDLVHRTLIDIVAPLSESECDRWDTIVGPFSSDGRPLDEQINGRPSMVRPAHRGVLARSPRAILVQRADQLGDLVCSVPALQRLRALFPDARLVALVTEANADLAHTLDMIDDVVVVNFAEDPDGRRVLSLQEQEALRRRLGAYRFDLAIDLGETSASRPLLLLSGAPFLYGFKDREFPWLSAGFELNTHDPVNHHEAAAVAHKLVAMIDALGEIAGSPPTILRRQDLDVEMLRKFGIGADDRYAVLHTGARLAYTRWPGFADLVGLLLERTDLKIVVMADDEWSASPVDDRVTTIRDRIAFDEFDALLQFCALFVGNDSGPKHLASLRGAPVVSIHMARLNWNEWGQEASGLIVSRRVPCAGCGIGENGEECGKEWACLRHITPEEVFQAASRLF
jgi:ADP-heptose:LPS heptosyltransferase